ncbi:MAG TPA: hypothetical protein PLM45_01110 [Caldisericia bacterium]|nr:hypothetical protein [Caldisericia bacterium]HQH48461.1 hypothetical protein [Caldisericia bacterium]
MGAGLPSQGNDTDFENPIILFGSNFVNATFACIPMKKGVDIGREREP